jgi:hypothetical protein
VSYFPQADPDGNCCDCPSRESPCDPCVVIPLYVVCRSRHGLINGCGWNPILPVPNPDPPNCFTIFKPFGNCTNGDPEDEFQNPVDCCNAAYKTNSSSCCYGEGPSESDSVTVGWADPVFRTSEADSFDVVLYCDYAVPPLSPTTPPPEPNLPGCTIGDTNYTDPVNFSDMRSAILAAMGEYAWPDYGDPVQVVDEYVGTHDGYCPVADSYGPACTLVGNDVQMLETDYKFVLDSSPDTRTLRWDEIFYPAKVGGIKVVTHKSESIAPGATESSVYHMSPQDPPRDSGEAPGGTTVVFNARIS